MSRYRGHLLATVSPAALMANLIWEEFGDRVNRRKSWAKDVDAMVVAAGGK